MEVLAYFKHTELNLYDVFFFFGMFLMSRLPLSKLMHGYLKLQTFRTTHTLSSMKNCQLSVDLLCKIIIEFRRGLNTANGLINSRHLTLSTWSRYINRHAMWVHSQPY